MRAFISYPDSAKKYAMEAKQIFERAGYETWIWDDDRPAIGNLDDVMHQAIRQSDYVVHICTRHTRRSDGQERERLFARVLRKKLVLLVFKPGLGFLFKPSFVPKDVEDRGIHNTVCPATFSAECARVAERLLIHEAEQIGEGEPLGVADMATAVDTIDVERGA